MQDDIFYFDFLVIFDFYLSISFLFQVPLATANSQRV